MWGLKSNKCFSGTGVTLGFISHFRPMSEGMFHVHVKGPSEAIV